MKNSSLLMMIRHISIITLVKWSLLITLKSLAKLKRLFGQFDTFPGGWLVVSGWMGGWMGQIKIIDHLSPAEAETRAELGNSKE